MIALPEAIQRNLTRITTVTTLLGAIIYILGLVDGTQAVTRIGALLFSLAATIEIADGSSTERPRGTVMISMAAFMLLMEGASTMLTQGIDKASYMEAAIGLYLMATLWQMVRR